MQRQNLIGTKVIHAAQSIHVDRDATLVPTVCGHFAAQGITPAWTGDAVDCLGCIRGINTVHRKALILNDLLNEGIAKGEQMLAQFGEHNFNSVSTDSELAGMLELQREWLATDLDTASDYLSPTMRKNLVSRASLIVLYTAELAFRTELHKADRARAQQTTADVMVTENNYGEQGPFHFTEHPHDQIRAQRYDSIINTLTEMVANANQPVPTTQQLIDAIVGLEHGEAIEEDRARFPHESFTRFGVPVPVKHRLADGTIEQVHMVGSDVSRRVYPQNVVLIARPYGMAQVVPEGDLVS